MLTFYRLDYDGGLLFAADDDVARDYAWRDGTWKDANDIVFGWRVAGNPYLERIEADEAEAQFPGSTGGVEKRYNSDQPRDDLGRWTSGASAPGRPSGYYTQRLSGAQNPDSSEWDADRTNLARSKSGTAKPTPASPTDLAANVLVPDGGFTYDPSSGMAIHSGFAVSPYGATAGESFPVKGETPESLAARVTAFQVRNRELLAKPGHMVGGWHNPEDGEVFLDVSIVTETAEEARLVGAEIGEKAFFDFQTFESVKIGD